MTRHHAGTVRRQGLADHRERVLDDLAPLAFADVPLISAWMDEEQRVVQARGEGELVALEEERGRAAHERREHGVAAVIDLDLLDARVVELGVPSIDVGQRDRCADVELAARDQGLDELRQELLDVRLRHYLPGGSSLRSGASG